MNEPDEYILSILQQNIVEWESLIIPVNLTSANHGIKYTLVLHSDYDNKTFSKNVTSYKNVIQDMNDTISLFLKSNDVTSVDTVPIGKLYIEQKFDFKDEYIDTILKNVKRTVKLEVLVNTKGHLFSIDTISTTHCNIERSVGNFPIVVSSDFTDSYGDLTKRRTFVFGKNRHVYHKEFPGIIDISAKGSVRQAVSYAFTAFSDKLINPGYVMELANDINKFGVWYHYTNLLLHNIKGPAFQTIDYSDDGKSIYGVDTSYAILGEKLTEADWKVSAEVVKYKFKQLLEEDDDDE